MNLLPRIQRLSILLVLLDLVQPYESAADWLITSVDTPSTVTVSDHGGQLTLSNGLASRTFQTSPNLATTSFRNLSSDAEYVRAIRPESVITINGVRWEIGGLKGQQDQSYLAPAWIPSLTAGTNAFRFTGHHIGHVEARYPWKPRYGAAPTAWPPKGTRLTLDFEPPARAADSLRGVKVFVHYEMYDGLPLVAKWLTVSNTGPVEILVDKLEVEVLAVTPDQRNRMLVDCDESLPSAVDWVFDTEWPTFVVTNPGDARFLPRSRDYLLRCDYSRGPAAAIAPGDSFSSFRVHELLLEDEDRERTGLAHRRMYRTLTPQVTENPIFLHLRNSDSESIRRAVDQCVDVGFEMVILTFWSGFEMESEDPAYIARIKADFDYAHSKGIKIGGYILLCTTASKGPANDAIDPKTHQPDGSLCLGSAYTDGYLAKLYRFMDATGMDVIETDGPYHGYACESKGHKYHRGVEDSIWVQWARQREFYRACIDRGIYINSPEWYFFEGSNKTPMGYREENWSLPRELQIVIGRQNIYDGTWHKTPSMGWMMLPLTEYHGGGPAATIEPLSQHLDAYGAHLAQNFGSGVIACYRGPRLFDTDETRDLVRKWTSFYKKYRDILNSDIVHVRRPDGRDVDCMLHVNPNLPQKGLAMVYNPLDEPVKRTLKLPLYYTGLTNRARIRHEEQNAEVYALDAKCDAVIPVEIAPRSQTWFVVEAAESRQ
ncbi:MAG TPA: alpha-galactosidase [Verrucomicrobiota bacterium]|nr:alpha-galactosidase [Verrucomicrobiales bacterium]HRI14094.1 alpha-galactosidase [Verrucomicrobiota bacterium]